MKKILAAALSVVMASSPAFAAIQNVKVSGDITSTFVDRNTFDLGETKMTNALVGGTTPVETTNFQPAGLKKQNVFLTQTRLRVDADLSDNVSTTVGLINERAWNAENTNVTGGAISNASPGYSNDTNVQLYLASLTLREFLYSPLTLTIGRQVFNYGNGLVMGDGGVNNQAAGNLQYIAQDLTMRTAYDGVKAVLDYKPLTIDMFYFKNNQLVLNGSSEDQQKQSSDVFGFNGNYQLSDPWSTVFEGYVFSRFNGNEDQTGPLGAASATTTKGDTLFVPGLRASTNPVKGLNFQGEVAWQVGDHPVINTIGGQPWQSAEHRRAMAAQVMASYALPVMDKYKPTVNASWTYVSGDKDGNRNYGTVPFKSAKYYTAWDPFNENQGAGTIYNTLFPLSNMDIITAGGSMSPLEDVTASFTWSGLWAAVPYSSTNPLVLFQPDGGATGINPQTKGKRRGLGNEYDVNLTYNYTEDVTFGLSLGWFVPGSVFTTNNNNTAQQALADVAVKF
jgi:hypothetical protein